ncbi:hypothetical protein [Nocardia sp. NPDC005366]|uniref:hypothetical protein n=1 Tax=Nocardia sp. NPDC005366 TaxID=3156878 RepID=UPI0033BCD6FF
MIILIGLLVLIAAVVVGVAGVTANSGEVRTDTSDFGVFDYHFTASAGELFLYGMAIGAIGMLGLSLLLAGLWRTSRRSSEARRELRRSRREQAAAERNAPAAAPAEPKKQISAPAPAQKPVWSLNRFLPKSSEPASVSTSRRAAADVPASK